MAEKLEGNVNPRAGISPRGDFAVLTSLGFNYII